MLVVGLTGGIGVGKSTVAQFLKEKGAIIIDADEVARNVVSPNGEIYKRLINRFGDEILEKDGSINRKKLGNVVFSDSEELEALDSLTHPPVVEVIKNKLKELEKTAQPNQVVVIDAPLLAEAGLLGYVCFVVVIAAKHDIRLERLEQVGFSHQEALARIRAQTPDNKRFEFADCIIRNEGTTEELREKVNEIWDRFVKIIEEKAEK